MYVVVTINGDGTAAVTTPIPATREAAESLAAKLGGEVVSQAVVEAIYANAVPPRSNFVPADSFRERLLPAYLRIASPDTPPAIVAKWERIIRDFLPPNRVTPVNVASAATVGLIQTLAADGLLTAEEVGAALG